MFGHRRSGKIVPAPVAAGLLAFCLAVVPLWLAFSNDAVAQDRDVRVYRGDPGYLIVREAETTSAWLGVHIEEEIGLSEGGARVTRVVEDSPADGAGLRAGDVIVGKVLPEMPAREAGIEVGDLIVAIDGAEIDGVGAIRKALRGRDGEAVRIDLIRDGSPMTIDVELPESDEEARHGGLTLL